MWFTQAGSSVIGRITPLGVVTEFPIPDPQVGTKLLAADLALGRDGNVWFTGDPSPESEPYLCSITPSGVVAEHKLPVLEEELNGVTVGPDGNIWFAGDNPDAIWQASPK